MKISKFVIGLAILAVAVLIFIGIVKFASVLGFLMLYPYVVQQVVGYGLNTYLAQAIGVLIAAALWFVVLKLFFAWREKKRMLGFGILIGFYVLHLLVMFLIPGNALVHPLTGERQFCVVNKLTGRIERFETAQFDRFGEKAKECTLDQIEKFEREKAFAEGENLEVPIGTVRKGFISPVTGAPLFYFCEDASNAPHFYVASGYCPWGGQLRAVSKEVLKKYEKIKSDDAATSSPITLIKPSAPVVVEQSTEETKPEKGWFWGFRERSETEVLFWVLCVIGVVFLIYWGWNLYNDSRSSWASFTEEVALATFFATLVVCFFSSVLFADAGGWLLAWGVPMLIAFVLIVAAQIGFLLFCNLMLLRLLRPGRSCW